MHHRNEWQPHQETIAGLAQLDFNYDHKMYEKTVDKHGWHIDQYEAEIGHEAPGEPEPGGAFRRAELALRNYEFPDPRLITAIYDPDHPIAGRNMLMRARFLGMSFYFGVRVVSVTETRESNERGEPCFVWGYSYRTLRGHFEAGEIRFSLWKVLSDGRISFRIDAYSRPDQIPNIAYRLGFRLFGRHLQRYFARSAIERLQKIVENNKETK